MRVALAVLLSRSAIAMPAWVGEWAGFPNALPDSKLPDVPLLGNGHVGVAVDARNDQKAASIAAGPGRNATVDFFINSNNFWSCSTCSSELVRGCCGTVAFGGVSVGLRSTNAAAFAATQSIASASVTSSLITAAGGALETLAYMHPDDSVIILNVTWAPANGDSPSVVLQIASWVLGSNAGANGGPVATSAGTSAGSTFVARLSANNSGAPWQTWGALATGVAAGGELLNTSVTANATGGLFEASQFVSVSANSTLSIIIVYGEAVAAVAADPTAAAMARLQDLLTSSDAAAQVAAAATVWWSSFWSKSAVSLPSQPMIERMWFGAQYVLAASSSSFSSGVAAPGLYGPWVSSDGPSWHGDYTLDYNYETPYYGAFSCGHAELAEAYWAPITDWMQSARTMAQQEGGAALVNCSASALHYACHLAPWGFQSQDQTVYMHWNGHFASLPFISHWEYTRNASFAAAVTYPLLDGLNAWWACYLSRANTSDGGYVYNDFQLLNPDAEHEGQLVPNPQIGMSFAARTVAAQLDMAAALNVTPPAYLADISAHLAPFNAVNVSVAANVTFNVTQDFRCHDDNGFLPTVTTWQACEAECAATATCAQFTFCPSRNVSGCDVGPSCWQFAVDAPCAPFPGFVSGARNGSAAVANASVWTAYLGATVAQSDWFAMYPVWPAEAYAGVANGSAYATTAVSSRVYSSFANGRPVDLFPAAVLAAASAPPPDPALSGLRWTLDDIVAGLNAFLAAAPLGRNMLAYAPGGGIENVAITHAVTAMLLSTSFNGVPTAENGGLVRLFPAWPPEQPAAFSGLIAKGGYRVDAAYDNVTAAVLSPVNVTVAYALDPLSTALRVPLQNPWPASGAGSITITCSGTPVAATVTAQSIVYNAPGVGVPCGVTLAAVDGAATMYIRRAESA